MGRSQELITPMTPKQLLDNYEREEQPKPPMTSLKTSQNQAVDQFRMSVPIGRIDSLTLILWAFLASTSANSLNRTIALLIPCLPHFNDCIPSRNELHLGTLIIQTATCCRVGDILHSRE